MLIETKIDLIDNKYQELTGSERLMPVFFVFKLDEVIAVREYIEDGEDEISPDKCMIYLKSGEFFIIHIAYSTMYVYLKQRQ